MSYYGKERKADVFDAFANRKSAIAGNWHSDGQALCLHGNRIATWQPDGSLTLTDAGWTTSTTASGLRAVLSLVTGRWELSRWVLFDKQTHKRRLWPGTFTIPADDLRY